MGVEVCFGFTGSLSEVNLGGGFVRVLEGLPSAASATEPLGPGAIAFIGNHKFALTIGLGGSAVATSTRCRPPRPSLFPSRHSRCPQGSPPTPSRRTWSRDRMARGTSHVPGLRQRRLALRGGARFRRPARRPIGSLVTVHPHSDTHEVVAGGLFAPYGVAIRGAHAYVTTGSVVAGGGQVVRVRL